MRRVIKRTGTIAMVAGMLWFMAAGAAADSLEILSFVKQITMSGCLFFAGYLAERV